VQFSFWAIMKQLIIITIFLVLLNNELRSSTAQRVAPGVPPQNYQNYEQGGQHQQFQHQPPQHHQQQQFQGQPPPPGQFRQQQQFQQHPPPQGQQQFQQPPPPQGQQHIQHQQVPVQHQVPQQAGGHAPGHGHHAPHGGPQKILDASNIALEREHIQEHMAVPIDTSQMSEQELQFHYFKMHDADNNNKLDGCELVKSLIHWHDQSNHDPKSGVPIPEAKVFTDDELVNMIDPILQNDDKNGDGFIDYAEFSLAQASAAAKAKHGATA